MRKLKLKHQPTATKLDEVATIIRPIEWGLSLIFAVLLLLLLIWGIFGQIAHRVEALGVISLEGSQSFVIDAPASGFMGSIHVKKGDLVEKGALLMEVISLEKPLANKETTFNYHKILSPAQAQVTEIFIEPGNHLSKKQPMVKLQTPGHQPEVHLYLPLNAYKQVRVGQEALVTLNHAEHIKALTGVIQHISTTPIRIEIRRPCLLA